MQENEPVLLVFSVFGREIIPEKGEILCEKQHASLMLDMQHMNKLIRRNTLVDNKWLYLNKPPFFET